MKVAVIGAGLSGLACANELQRMDIDYDVFERKQRVGEGFPHVGALLQIINRPVKDPLKYIEEIYNIKINPTYLVKRVAMHAPNVSSNIRGSALGYFVRRGQDKNSAENQLISTLRKPVNFCSHEKPEELSSQYDAVVVATGSQIDTPQRLGVWTPLLETWVHGATVLGNFDVNKLEMWLDTDFAKSGYAYLCPFDEKHAVLALAATYVNEEELPALWDLFWQKQKFPYKIVQQFTLPHVSGFVYPHKVDNIYFVGIAGGFLEPFLGFGQYHALISGVVAARCIAEGKDYEKELEPFIKEVMYMLDLRQAIDKFDNNDFDRLVRILGIPGLNQLIYNTNLNIIKHSSTVLGALGKVAMKKLFRGKDI